MVRVCPKRDTVCPHGMSCPFSINRYMCATEPQEDKAETAHNSTPNWLNLKAPRP